MKNIFITESQYNKIRESVFEKTQTKSIFGDKYSPLASIVSNEQVEKLLSKREIEVREIVQKLFNDNTIYSPHNISKEISRLLKMCSEREDKIKEFLEKLCFDSVTELFSCPDGLVNLSCSLVKQINNKNTTIHVSPIENDIEFANSNEIDITTSEIQKRKILNIIVVGASIVLTKHMIKEKKNEILKLDNFLYDCYRKLLWLNEYYMFQETVKVTDETPNQAGGVDVKLGSVNKQTIIDSKALCFPILLFETIKGFFELFISHGLPKDKKTAEYIINQADALEYQQYAIAIGPVLWNKFMSVLYNNGTDTSILPHFIHEISQLEVDDFNLFVKEIVLNTKLGKQKIEDLLLNITNSLGYDDFEERLKQKREEKNILNDSEYMSDDELLDEQDDFNKKKKITH